VTVSSAGIILPIRHIQRPVAAVFDLPVAANCFGKLFHAHLQTADEIPDIDRFVVSLFAARESQTDRVQVLETDLTLKFFRQRKLNVCARVVSTMFDFFGCVFTRLNASEVVVVVFVYIIDDRIVKCCGFL
jgi:hypothetical protein